MSKWISVKDRLPDIEGAYLTTVRYIGEMEDCEDEIDISTWFGKSWIYLDDSNWECKKVVAWQPLPSPYKGE